MFVNMGFAAPRPGKEKGMAESMRSFARVLEGTPGLPDTFILSEDGGGTLVGVSIWRDRKAFEAAMEKVRPAPPPEPVEQMRLAPLTIGQFESV